MLRNVIILLACLWTLQSSGQKTDYPRKVLTPEGDTIVEFLQWQHTYINEHYIYGLEVCEHDKDTMYSFVEDVLVLLATCREQSAASKKEDTIHTEIHKKDEVIIGAQKKDIKDLKKKNFVQAVWGGVKEFGGYGLAATLGILYLTKPTHD